MECNGEQVYENPTVIPPTECKHTVKGKPRSAGPVGGLSLKAAPILGLVLLLAVLVTMIGLHFQQKSEFEKEIADITSMTRESYQQLSEDLKKLTNEIAVLKNTSQELRREETSMKEIVAILKSNLSNVEDNSVSLDLIETCDFIYKRKCYFLLMSEPRVDRPEAEALCRGKGGNLADIVDRVHFEKAQSLIRSRIFIGFGYNHIWTGMTVDIQQRRIRLSTGEWAPYQRWYPGRPLSPVREVVGIHTDINVGSANSGMFDEHKTYKLLGGLCQKNIK